MSNNEFSGLIPEGYLLGRDAGEKSVEDFSWASMLMPLFYVYAGHMPQIESFADFKKTVSDFNDIIQAMELPKLEVSTDEV